MFKQLEISDFLSAEIFKTFALHDYDLTLFMEKKV
jgi:hypothetical protein